MQEADKHIIIKPTVGRVVWYKPYPQEGIMASKSGNCAAIIAEVHSDHCVNLTIFDANGQSHGRTSVPLMQEGSVWPAPAVGIAQWMPYQKGQAAKTEAAQTELLRATQNKPTIGALAQSDPAGGPMSSGS